VLVHSATAIGPAYARVAAVAGSERARRWIVLLCFVVILLLVGEGAIRKWVAPTQGRLLFFVRDPFVIAVYALALFSGWWPRGRVLLNAGLAFGVVGALLAGLQLMTPVTAAGTQALLAVYGWRNYFLYLPLLFVIGATFRREDVARVGMLFMLLAIPIALLVALQFASPPGAKINVGISDDIAFQFKGLGLGLGRVRPAGPFSSDIGMRMFIAATTAFALAGWLRPKAQRDTPVWLVLAGSLGVLSCIAFSGSRGAVMNVGIVMLAAIGSAVVMRAGAGTVRALTIPPLLAIAAWVLYPIVFPEGHEAFSDRWQAAAAVEAQSFRFGLIGRALYGFVDFASLVGPAPVLGYGLGLAGNASLVLRVEIEGFTGWAETDWARHVVDLGPLFAALYIAFRIVLVGWLGVLALRALRARADPLPALLVAFAGIELLQGQITGHGSVNGFAWVFGGLALAAAAGPTSAVPRANPRSGAPAPSRWPNLLR
jgi:hypothetical protein